MTSRVNMKEDFYTMEFIVNDIVFVSFKKDLKSIGINYNEGFFKIKGHDDDFINELLGDYGETNKLYNKS